MLLGLAVARDGAVWACDAGNRVVVRIDPDDGTVTVVSGGAPGRALIEPNGIAVAPDGHVYVTCSGHWGADDGVVLRIDSDGSTDVWSRAVRAYPKRLCRGVRAARRRRIAPASPRPHRPRRSGDLPRSSFPDQAARAPGGTMVVGCYRPDVLLGVGAQGEVRELASDPHGLALAAPTGVVFAGASRDVLVVANFAARELVVVPRSVWDVDISRFTVVAPTYG
jgi:hypothetical protein